MDSVARLAPLAVTLLISILAYGSQVLFFYIEPYALDKQQAIIFNTLITCLWICYARACLTNPGRVPEDWLPKPISDRALDSEGSEHGAVRNRWCKKCKMVKPPRAHHCKTCQR